MFLFDVHESEVFVSGPVFSLEFKGVSDVKENFSLQPMIDV